MSDLGEFNGHEEEIRLTYGGERWVLEVAYKRLEEEVKRLRRAFLGLYLSEFGHFPDPDDFEKVIGAYEKDREPFTYGQPNVSGKEGV